MNEKNSCGFSTEYISYSVFVLVWHLLINSQFSKSKVDDNYHTYNNTLSINHSKIGNRPKSALRILFNIRNFLLC